MADRDLSAELESGVESPEFLFVVFVYLDFPSGVVRAHNSVGTYHWGGEDWLGVGAFGSISPIEENTDLVDSPIKVGLSGVDDDIVDAVSTENIKGRDAKIYVGAVDHDGVLQGTPHEWLTGFMEYGEMVDDEEMTVSISINTLASRLGRRNNLRYTLEDHQLHYPGDLFLEYLPWMVEAKVTWGGERVRAGFYNDSEVGAPASTPKGRPGPGEGPTDGSNVQ